MDMRIPSQRVVLALVAVIVLPGILFTGLLVRSYVASEQARYERDAVATARAAAAVVDQLLDGWHATLQTLATSQHFRTGNFAQLYEQALQARRFLGADLTVRRSDGQLIFNTRRPFGTELPASIHPAGAQALATRRAVVTGVFRGAVAERPLVAMTVPVPTQGGEVEFLLYISADPELLRAKIDAVVPGGWYVSVIDQASAYVLRTRDHAAFVGKPVPAGSMAVPAAASGTFVDRNARGAEVLRGYARPELAPWLVVANIEKDIIEAPLRTALLGFLALGLGGLVAMAFAVRWLWGLIDWPLSVLTEASASIGRLAGPIEVPTRLREFAALRDALSHASERIRADSLELETRVRARTRELGEANDRLTAEIQQRAQVQAMLVQAQKMESIGNLTGGIAHDFNNLLQVISANLQLLVPHTLGNAKAELRVKGALEAVRRGAKLTQQLLAFARRQPLAPQSIDLRRLLAGMDDILRRALGAGVELRTYSDDALWNTLVDPGNLENALLNLAINARDAMQAQGTLTIEARNVQLAPGEAALLGEGAAAGRYVMLAVRDTGSGMSEAVLQRAFDPFFTTKPPGKGTGLGLSMVYGFVRQSGGFLQLHSTPGQGTTVKLYLPHSAGPEQGEAGQEPHSAGGGTEHILVVEDDEAVREGVAAMLGQLGYRVTPAADAQSALALIEAGAPIDLLFTDVVMPGPLRSVELVRMVRKRWPQIGVLFTSGYPEGELGELGEGGRLDPRAPLLSKPYTHEALARKIRQILAHTKENL